MPGQTGNEKRRDKIKKVRQRIFDSREKSAAWIFVIRQKLGSNNVQL